MGLNEYNTMFKLSGGDAAAVYTMREAERSMTPLHWNLYVAVESADASARLAGELGGTVIAAQFDVMTFGRMPLAAAPQSGCDSRGRARHGLLGGPKHSRPRPRQAVL